VDLANRLNIIPGAIRLREGTPGMGWRHIEKEHGDHIAGAGYETLEDLVATVLGGYSEVRMIMEAEPEKEHEIGRLVLVKRDKKRGLAAIELTPSWRGDCYEVVSAYPIRAKQKIRGELLGSAGESAASVPGSSGTPTYRPGSNLESPAAGGVRTGAEQPASESIQSLPQKGSQGKPDSGKLPGGRQAGGTILFSSDEWRRLVAEGRRLFSEGADQFGAWSEAMVAAAGEEIRPALQQLWQLAINPAVEPKQEKTWERVNPTEAAASSLAEIQQSLEHLTYEALKSKAKEIGVAVRGKKAQLAALIAEAIKAKAGPEVRRMAQRTVRARCGPQKGQKIKRQVQVVTTRIADSKALRDTEKQIREHPVYQMYAESAGYIEKGVSVESRTGRVDPDKVYFVEPKYKGEVEGGQGPGSQGVRAARRICLLEFPGGLSTGETTEDDDLAAGKSRSQ